jgi:hypothetical protein
MALNARRSRNTNKNSLFAKKAFPDQAELFPCSAMELCRKPLNWLVDSGKRRRAHMAKKSQNSLFFSLLTGNIAAAPAGMVFLATE